MLKVTIFYNQNNHGWTETWWAPGSSPPTVLNAGLKSIMAAAVKFRSALTTIEWVRFSVVGKPQLVNSFRLSNKVSAQTNASASPDVVSTDALWRIITSTFARRTISLRGLLDNSVLRNALTGAFEPTPGLVADVDAYLTKVSNVGWLIRTAQTVANTPGLVQSQVLAIKRNPTFPTQTDLSLVPTIPGLTAGDKLRFYGKIDPKLLPQFPRTPTVLEVLAGPPQVVRIGYTMPNDLAQNPANMLATKLIYNFEPVFDWDFQALSKRDTGRPFGSGRGRRSAAGSRR